MDSPGTDPLRIPGWIQVILHATQYGTERINTWSYNAGTTFTISDAQLTQIAESMIVYVQNDYATNVSNTVTFLDVTVNDLSAVDGHQVVVPFPPNTTGTLGGDGAPGNVSAGIRWKTNRPGKSYRGRIEVFGIGDGQTVGNTFTNAFILGILNFARDISTYTGPVGLPLVLAVASRVHHVLTDVLSFAMDAYSDSQRTRLQTKGR